MFLKSAWFRKKLANLEQVGSLIWRKHPNMMYFLMRAKFRERDKGGAIQTVGNNESLDLKTSQRYSDFPSICTKTLIANAKLKN